MANILKVSAQVQNIWPASSTKKSVKHRMPDFTTTIASNKSAVLSLTGTGASHTLYLSGGVMSSSEGDPINPITGAALAVTGNIVTGFAVYVTRAVAATAPTGWVELTNSGMCNWSGGMVLHEGAYVLFHDPESAATSNSTGLAFDLSTGTGYRVDVITYFE